MKIKDFRVDGFYTTGNWGGLEVMVESEDIIRYRAVFSKEDEEGAKVSRPCKIYTTNEGRAYFNYRGSRVYLDEVMNANI